MKKILFSIFALCMALTASAIKVYIDPGHGGWNADSRNMLTITHPSYSDTAGFWESNTNLWKSWYFEKKLKDAGYTVMKSRNSCFYGENRELHVIAQESQSFGSDYFVSVHSNAHVDGYTTNYPALIHKGYDNSETNAGSIAGEKSLWPHLFAIWSAGMEYNSYYSETSMCIRGGLSMNGWDYGVLNYQYRPGTLAEGYFHTYQPARHRALNTDWCRQEGLRFARGIKAHFGTAKETKGYIMGYVRTKSREINQTNYTGRSGNDIYMPLNGAKVVLRDANGKVVKTDSYNYAKSDALNMGKQIYTTDDEYNGVFVYDDLTPGTYSISVHCAGYADYKQNITVTADKTSYTQIFMTPGTGTEPDVNEIMGTSGLNPYAYDLTSSWDEATQKLTVKFSLNADAYIDGDGGYADGVQIYVSDDKNTPRKYYVHGLSKNDCKQGQNKTFTIDLSSGLDKKGNELPKGKPLYVSVAVQGDRSNTAPREYSLSHRVYCPFGVAVDNNPNSKNFGKIFVNEAYQYEQGGDLAGYFTKGKAGMYVLDADFQQRNTNRYTGGYDFSWYVIEHTFDGLARKGYQPWRVRVSEEGRIFVCSNDMHQRQATDANGNRDGVAVWEVDRNDFNKWTPVLHGTRQADYTFTYKDINGVEQYIGPVCGMDVKGKGDDLTLLLYTVNKSGVDLDMKAFRAYEYNVKSGALKPIPAFNNGGYGYVFEHVTLRYGLDGSYWFGGNRADGSDGVEGNGKTREPNLGHVKLDGTTADYTNYNSEFYGGSGLLVYKSTYNNSACNASNHTWMIKGKDNGGGSDGLFDVFMVNSTDGGGAGVTRMDGNGGRPNWQNITASGMGRFLNDMAIDYAENLYIVGSSNGMVRAFAMPYCGEKTTTVREEFAFSFPAPVVEKDSIEWHPYPKGYSITNQDLWEQFVEDTAGTTITDMLTNDQSAWKWLGDYIRQVHDTVEEQVTWEQAASDFFNTDDVFVQAGQPEAWSSLWWEATFPDTLDNGAAMPKVKRHGWALECWYYGNSDGYYYFGETVKDNKYDEMHKDSIDLWARWVEKCLYEGYEPYIESGDTSAIDLRTWTLTANEDLLALTQGTTTDMAIKRPLTKDVYNSLYLPFDVTAEVLAQFKTADGSLAFDTLPAIYIYETDTVVEVEGSKELQLRFREFADGDTIKAGVPFLIKPAKDITEKLYLESVYVTKGQKAEVQAGEVDFVGLWQPASTEVSEEYDVLMITGDETLQLMTETTTIMALNAYFKVPATVEYDKAVITLVVAEVVQPTLTWHPYPAGYTITNDDLWAQFVEDTLGQSLTDMLTNEQSAWKWLGDYIQDVDSTIAAENAWEIALSDFFNAENNFATAGQPASWDSLWWSANFPDTLDNGATMPKVKRKGWIFENWRYGNKDGYYYYNQESIVQDSMYDESKKDSTDLWARWIEQCLYENYMPYIESGDTSAIDLKSSTITANDDVVKLTNGKTLSMDIHRTLLPNQYNTLCLPMTVSADKETFWYQITDKEGNPVFDPAQGGAEPTILIFDGANIVMTPEADVELRLNFHKQREAEDIPANVPFIIIPEDSLPQRLTLPVAEITNAMPESEAIDEVEFVGLFMPKSLEIATDCKYVLVEDANKLSVLSEGASVLGLSGYFIVPNSLGAFDRATIHIEGKEATDLDLQKMDETKVTKIIRNQQILILRGGETYSVLGQQVR